MQPVSNQPWMDSSEFARLINMSDEGVRRRCRLGEIEAIKIGSRWRISPQAIEKLLAGK